MKYIVKFLLSAFIFICANNYALFAQNSNNLSSRQKTYERNSENINKYLNDDFYKYSNEKAVQNENLFDKIIRKIISLISNIFQNKTSVNIFYIIVFALLLFVIFKLAGLKYENLFFSRKKLNPNPKIIVYDSDISDINFDELIQKYILKKEYKNAVKYLYFKYLKILINNNILIYKLNKTTSDYKSEIENTNYTQNFKILSEFFEYVYFGRYSLTDSEFNYTNSVFNSAFAQFNEK